MHPSNKARLVLLSAKLKKNVTEFRSKDEESHTARNAALVAGGGAAAYGAATTIRGRLQAVGPRQSGARGVASDFLRGNAMNVGDAKTAIAAGKKTVAAGLAAGEGLLNTASAGISGAAKEAKYQGMRTVAKIRTALRK